MSKKKKSLERLEKIPRNLTFFEAKKLLECLGFKMFNKGKTSGSRVKFMKDGIALILHKPHPGKELKEYQIKQLFESLKENGLLG